MWQSGRAAGLEVLDAGLLIWELTVLLYLHLHALFYKRARDVSRLVGSEGNRDSGEQKVVVCNATGLMAL